MAAAAACAHTSLVEQNGVSCCRSCGQILMTFGREDTGEPLARGVPKIKSIRKELDTLTLPSIVKDYADEIYADKVGTNTYRSDVRAEVKFNCLYEAYQRAGIICDPAEIAQMLGIKRRGMSRGLLRCSELYTGKKNTMPPPKLLTAMDLVPGVLSKCDIQPDQEHIDDINRLYLFAKERSTLFNCSKPQSLTAALIYYYLRRFEGDRKFTKGEIAANCGVSIMTLTKGYKELERLVPSTEN